jgi:hypothetical protein
MSDWSEDAVRAAVARLEANGATQSADTRASLGLDTQSPAKKARAPQKPAHKAEGALQATPPKLGTEAGMVALWADALAEHGADLPAPVEQYHFAAPWRNWRADYAWPAARLLVELDGMAWQAGGGHHNTDEDRFRNNSAAALGWRMLHFTSRALRTDPAECMALLRRALETTR